jgi:ABC-2 type transport system permease protein
VTRSGDQIVVHYSAADQVQSGSVRGVLAAIVQEANLRSAGVTEPRYALSLQPVEDTSLQPIQFLTPGWWSPERCRKPRKRRPRWPT